MAITYQHKHQQQQLFDQFLWRTVSLQQRLQIEQRKAKAETNRTNIGLKISNVYQFSCCLMLTTMTMMIMVTKTTSDGI